MRRQLIATVLASSVLTASSAVAQSYPQQPTYPRQHAPVAAGYQPAMAQSYPQQHTPVATGYQAAGVVAARHHASHHCPPGAPCAVQPQHWHAPDTATDSSSGTELIVAGSVMLGSFYLLSALSAAGLAEACAASLPDEVPDEIPDGLSLCGDASPSLGAIPLVGPFVAMAELQDGPIAVWPVDVGLIVLGLGQITGAGLLIGGLVEGAETDEKQPSSIQLRPIGGPMGAGLALSGRF